MEIHESTHRAADATNNKVDYETFQKYIDERPAKNEKPSTNDKTLALPCVDITDESRLSQALESRLQSWSQQAGNINNANAGTASGRLQNQVFGTIRNELTTGNLAGSGWTAYPVLEGSPMDAVGGDILLVNRQQGRAIMVDVTNGLPKPDARQEMVIDVRNDVRPSEEPRAMVQRRLAEIIQNPDLAIDLNQVRTLPDGTRRGTNREQIAEFARQLEYTGSLRMGEWADDIRGRALRFAGSENIGERLQSRAQEIIVEHALGIRRASGTVSGGNEPLVQVNRTEGGRVNINVPNGPRYNFDVSVFSGAVDNIITGRFQENAQIMRLLQRANVAPDALIRRVRENINAYRSGGAGLERELMETMVQRLRNTRASEMRDLAERPAQGSVERPAQEPAQPPRPDGPPRPNSPQRQPRPSGRLNGAAIGLAIIGSSALRHLQPAAPEETPDATYGDR